MLTNAAMRGAPDPPASPPGEWVTYADISEYTGKSRAQVRGYLRRLTRLIGERLCKERWPFEAPWRPEKNDFGFRMDAATATGGRQRPALDQEDATSKPPGRRRRELTV